MECHDRKTRFLLASKVSEARDINGAVAVFKEAIKNANGQNPKEIHTDALRAYREGISQNFKASIAARRPAEPPPIIKTSQERFDSFFIFSVIFMHIPSYLHIVIFNKLGQMLFYEALKNLFCKEQIQ
jgi:hypothetical protein